MTAAAPTRLAALLARRADPAAQAEVVASMAGMIAQTAHAYRRMYHLGISSLDDLIAEGQIGVLRAIRGFDATRGAAFPTYAREWIRAMISIWCADHCRAVRLPRSAYKSAMKRTLDVGTFDDANLAAQLAVGNEVHLDAPLSARDSHERTLLDSMITTLPAPDDAVMRDSDATEAQRLLARLPVRDQRVLRARFFEDKTLHEIGVSIGGLSRERVRQLEKRALERVREMVGVRRRAR